MTCDRMGEERNQIWCFLVAHCDARLGALQRDELRGFQGRFVGKHEKVRNAFAVRELKAAFLHERHDTVHCPHRSIALLQTLSFYLGAPGSTAIAPM